MHSINYHLSSNLAEKPYIVLLHGLFGSLDNLSMVRKALESTYNVLSIDLPDHGKSAFTEKFSFHSYAQKIVELLTDLDIQKVAILGHSLGGKIAMTIALNFPNLVEKLIVADIAPVSYTPRHQNVFKALNAVNLPHLTSRTEADKTMSAYLHEAGVSQFLLKSLKQTDGQWRWDFNLALLERDYAELSKSIACDTSSKIPVLFIKGGLSDYILPEHKQVISKLFPNSSAKVIGSAGHWLHAQKPQIFNRLVVEFLQKDA
ncbi:alpha/beta fold hydrolase [Aliiglaciecola lipolytica]|uniref:Abhydrolase domain-containing protein 11 n=1 Tax=Aliiglaciecola lipolytica E3 TaxID=1127673 RepID=K6XSD7_9ALTE|nr:alpha/beta fold hydrolase [Aliiglaciecola lipolytica]GAC14601.1 abhydrolase domain-containing protein 11 [Aliiglaciecola lipolytica E3]